MESVAPVDCMCCPRLTLLTPSQETALGYNGAVVDLVGSFLFGLMAVVDRGSLLRPSCSDASAKSDCGIVFGLRW